MTATEPVEPPAPASRSTLGTDGTAPTVSPARIAALLGYVFRACMPARRLGILALPCLAIIGSGLLTRTDPSFTLSEAFARIAGISMFGLALPLGALVVGDAVLGAEVRSGTFAFTWLTPARFGEIAFTRWLGGSLICAGTLVPSCALAAVLGGAPDQAVPVAIGAAAGCAAHVALFVFVGAVTRRAAVWSLAIVFLVERLLGAVLSGIAQLSPTWQGRAAYVGIGDTPADMSRSGIPEGWDAVVRLGLLTTVFVVGATLGLRRLRLSGSRD